MKTLRRYLLRQVIASLLMTVAVFTFVLLLVNVLREILPLLVSRQVTFGLVAHAFGLLIPFVWVFALPMGMLTATLLVFGRFSADQELMAARASGVSLLSLVTPILILSLALCGVSALVNLEIAPRCRVAYTQLRSKLQAVLVTMRLPDGQVIKDFPGYVICIGKNRKQTLQDVRLWSVKNETNLEFYVNAPRGRLELDTTNQAIVLHLDDANLIYVASSVTMSGNFTFTLDLPSAERAAGKPGINDMTFSQLRRELGDLERRINVPLPAGRLAAEYRRLETRELQRVRVQMHRQAAFSFACFGFTLVGIPLGIRVHRRETNIGIAVALGLVALYYALIIAGSSLGARPEWLPHLLMWLPDFLFQGVGAVLLWRANRGL